MLPVKVIFHEQTAVKIWRHLENITNIFWKMTMAAMKFVVKSLKKKHFQPFVYKNIGQLRGCFVGFPEGSQEFHVSAKPALPLDKVEEHTPAKELQGIVMSPTLVACLFLEVSLQNVEYGLIFIKELFGDSFNIKCLVVAILNRER